MIGNIDLPRCLRGAIKRDFQTYIPECTSLVENVEYAYPHSNALLQSHLQLGHCKPYKATRHQTKCDVINHVKLFLKVYRCIYSSQIFDIIQSDVALQNQVH